jgi:hypothetical protein
MRRPAAPPLHRRVVGDPLRQALRRQAAWARAGRRRDLGELGHRIDVAPLPGPVALDLERRLPNLEQAPAQQPRDRPPASRQERHRLLHVVEHGLVRSRVRACSAARAWYSAASAASPASSKCLAASPRKSLARSPVCAPASAPACRAARGGCA